MSTRLRYKIVTLWCRLLGHPAPRVEYASGVAWTRCPCGHIEISDRPFRRGMSPNRVVIDEVAEWMTSGNTSHSVDDQH